MGRAGVRRTSRLKRDDVGPDESVERALHNGLS